MLIPVQLPPGLDRNNSPYDTPNRWFDMNLVRWQHDTMRPVGGWNRLTSTSLNNAARKIYVYRDNDTQRKVLIGTDSKLYTDTGAFTDITPAAFTALTSIGVNGGYGSLTYGSSTYGTARSNPAPVFTLYAYWTFDNWGEDVILTANSDGRLFYYTSDLTTTAPAVITSAPTGNNAVIVTDERHVMAIGQAGGSGGNPRRVAWSSREDYTDWNFSSTTNTAGFQDLTCRTPLIKGVHVREGVLIFSRTEVFLAQYVGQPFIYGFPRLSDVSLMHPDSVVPFNGRAVWPSRSGFRIYDGGSVMPLECPLLGTINKELDPLYGEFRIHGAHNGAFAEIWWFYPTVGNTEANRYIIWNYEENWWGWGMLARSAMSPGDTYKYPIMGDSTGNVFEHEVGFTDAGAARFPNIFAETAVLGDSETSPDINAIQIANGTGYDKVTVTAFTRITPEGAEHTYGPYSPRANGWTDARIAGPALPRLRFKPTVDEEWGVGKIYLDPAKKQGGMRR
jgi:hypothetical protein